MINGRDDDSRCNGADNDAERNSNKADHGAFLVNHASNLARTGADTGQHAELVHSFRDGDIKRITNDKGGDNHHYANKERGETH